MLLAALLLLVVGTALLMWAGAIADYLAQVHRPYADRWSYARFYADANKTRPVFRVLGVGFVVGAVMVLIGVARCTDVHRLEPQVAHWS